MTRHDGPPTERPPTTSSRTGTRATRLLRAARIDLVAPHAMPGTVALAVATVLSVGGSLAADAALVAAGRRLFPAVAGYGHFHVADYATLTVLGVVAACAAWPLVARVSTDPRWLFLRAAVAATVVLLVPDAYLLVRHQPVRAVGVLVSMHLAIAVVTYNVLVHVAAPRAVQGGVEPIEGARDATEVDLDRRRRWVHRLALLLVAIVGVEFVLGVAALVVVPLGRPSGWVPSGGTAIYLAHAALGIPLGIGALVLLERARSLGRIYALTGWIGGVGVAVAGVGGLLSVEHGLRIAALLLMFVGPATATFGYFLPSLDRLRDDSTQGTAR